MPYEKINDTEIRECERCGGDFLCIKQSTREHHLKPEECIEELGRRVKILSDLLDEVVERLDKKEQSDERDILEPSPKR